MKIAIKTSHGYLSFQPDGRIEYRQNRGIWEELEIEGLTLSVGNPADNNPPVDSNEPPFPPSQSGNYVSQIKNWLQSQGKDLSGPCGAFLITSWVAWGLRGQGFGVLSKPSGNNCRGFSTDYLVNANGDGVDILIDGGGTNGPQWSVQPGEFAGQNRWSAPQHP